MPSVKGMSNFFSFWGSNGDCGNSAAVSKGQVENRQTWPGTVSNREASGELQSHGAFASLPPGAKMSNNSDVSDALGRHRPRPHTGDEGIDRMPMDVAEPPVNPFTSYQVSEADSHTPQHYINDAALRARYRDSTGIEDVEEARAEAARLREALQRAEEKLAIAGVDTAVDSHSKKVVKQRMGYFVQQEEVFEVPKDTPVANGQIRFPVLDKVVTAPQLDYGYSPHNSTHGQSVHDRLSITAPPAASLVNSMAPGQRYPSIEVQVETLATSPAAAKTLAHAGSMRADEACWRVRHVRCDNAKMPTALRARPSGKEPPLQDIIVAPLEEVLILESHADPKEPNSVWSKISCIKGQGWMKRMHLKEGGWCMRHLRSDNAKIPTALRERPTNTAKPLPAIKAEPHDEVLVHVQMEVQEGGRTTTWARVACSKGEGWIKREHLKDPLPKETLPPPPPGPKIEELPDDASEIQSNAVPSSPRTPPDPFTSLPGGSYSPRGPSTPVATGQTAFSTGQPCSVHQHNVAFSNVVSLGAPTQSPMQSRASTVARDDDETGSDLPACGVRIRLGALEFVSTSVAGSISVFDTVSFRAMVQLGGAIAEGGPPARWLDEGPITEARTLKYGRSISEDGRYGAKVCCQFDEAIDLPWPPQYCQDYDKVSVDIYIERTTVADHFDRVLGNLGLHSPAGIDRRWIGRAVADLPPEGVDDNPFAWPVEGSAVEKCPVPQTMSVGVEWVYQPLDSL